MATHWFRCLCGSYNLPNNHWLPQLSIYATKPIIRATASSELAMLNQTFSQLTAKPGYRAQSFDVSIEADLLDFYKLRQLSIQERVEYADDLMTKTRTFSLTCLSQQFSYLSFNELARKIAKAWLQEDYPPNYAPCSADKMSWIQNSPELAVQLHYIFESAGVPYFVVGGVAAIAYGDPRTTRDLDVVVKVSADNVQRLKSVLEQSGFYVAGAEDVQTSSLQITSRESIARADLMVASEDDYTQRQFARRQRYKLLGEDEVYLASPEDVILGKLRWGIQSESEKQQRDVLAILKVQQSALNYQYLYYWGERFEIAERLSQLTIAAGVKDIADAQWGSRFYSVVKQLFALAKQAKRIVATEFNEEIATGRRYNLTLNKRTNMLMITDSVHGRPVAQFDEQGQVISAAPTLSDRQYWRNTAERMRENRNRYQKGDMEI